MRVGVRIWVIGLKLGFWVKVRVRVKVWVIGLGLG